MKRLVLFGILGIFCYYTNNSMQKEEDNGKVININECFKVLEKNGYKANNGEKVDNANNGEKIDNEDNGKKDENKEKKDEKKLIDLIPEDTMSPDFKRSHNYQGETTIIALQNFGKGNLQKEEGSLCCCCCDKKKMICIWEKEKSSNLKKQDQNSNTRANNNEFCLLK